VTRTRRARSLRIGRAAQARLGWWVGWLVASAGVYLLFGLPVALIVVGLVIAATFLLLHDVDESGGATEEVRIR
jgi:fatty acid desaturase